MTDNEKIDWDSIFWAASKENKDPEVREWAKDILDKMCFLQQMYWKRADKNGKRH